MMIGEERKRFMLLLTKLCHVQTGLRIVDFQIQVDRRNILVDYDPSRGLKELFDGNHYLF